MTESTPAGQPQHPSQYQRSEDNQDNQLDEVIRRKVNVEFAQITDGLDGDEMEASAEDQIVSEAAEWCAHTVREYYLAYLEAGFNEDQALWLAAAETQTFNAPGGCAC